MAMVIHEPIWFHIIRMEIDYTTAECWEMWQKDTGITATHKYFSLLEFFKSNHNAKNTDKGKMPSL
jgi:hypothetical protein